MKSTQVCKPLAAYPYEANNARLLAMPRGVAVLPGQQSVHDADKLLYSSGVCGFRRGGGGGVTLGTS